MEVDQENVLPLPTFLVPEEEASEASGFVIKEDGAFLDIVLPSAATTTITQQDDQQQQQQQQPVPMMTIPPANNNKRSVHWNPEVKIRNVEILDQPFGGWVGKRHLDQSTKRMVLPQVIGFGLSPNEGYDSIEDLDTQVARRKRRNSFATFNFERALKRNTSGDPIMVIWPEGKREFFVLVLFTDSKKRAT